MKKLNLLVCIVMIGLFFSCSVGKNFSGTYYSEFDEDISLEFISGSKVIFSGRIPSSGRIFKDECSYIVRDNKLILTEALGTVHTFNIIDKNTVAYEDRCDYRPRSNFIKR